MLKWCMVFLAAGLGAQGYTPSPEDWRDQSIYFLVTDRFANGDKSNDDFGKGEFKADDVEFYHGGDLKGLKDRMAYIKGMGFSAIWLTPQVANQWISPKYGKTRYSGYHGYWAQDFFKVDAHLGSLEDYKAMVKEAHAQGIYVIQDIVVNHMGDFYSEDGKILEQDGYPNFPAAPLAGKDKAAQYFHFNGTTLETKGFFNLLDDINTENPEVVQGLIDAFKYWIKEADIDGYRIDTVKYVGKAFWDRFIPEIRQYAASLGKKNFIIFGEAYPYDDLLKYDYAAADKHMGFYTGTDQTPLFNSMLDFSICAALTKAFAGTSLTGDTKKVLGSFKDINERYLGAGLGAYTKESQFQRINFFDNHDMMRYLNERKNNGNLKNLRLVLGALFTLPGVPKLYYGTEQGFNQPKGIKNGKPGFDNRQDLWPTNYNTQAEIYQFIAKLSDLRQKNSELRRGSFVPRITDGEGGDLWVYSRALGPAETLVVINRGGREVTANLGSWMTQGTDLLTGQKLGSGIRVPPETLLLVKKN